MAPSHLQVLTTVESFQQDDPLRSQVSFENLSIQVPKSTDDHLHPPKPEKMFLISPPCSPPVGWEQHREAEPVLNFELIQALSNLSPGLKSACLH
ncbi:hypothetical protein C0Q70_11241 [Pomacea canaliculata]|uniref:Uncharacterized protein n=1 Tax=Pomacea canaliculata TaxID=400727 RepID=A0A2T7P5E7_POMCA|nr:hypothetical protein C0Q70_11241 [Pomacea canaliculata]